MFCQQGVLLGLSVWVVYFPYACPVYQHWSTQSKFMSTSYPHMTIKPSHNNKPSNTNSALVFPHAITVSVEAKFLSCQITLSDAIHLSV